MSALVFLAFRALHVLVAGLWFGSSVFVSKLLMTDGPAKGALIQQTVGLRRRIKAGSSVVIVLQTMALVLMAVGHYI